MPLSVSTRIVLITRMDYVGPAIYKNITLDGNSAWNKREPKNWKLKDEAKIVLKRFDQMIKYLF